MWRKILKIEAKEDIVDKSLKLRFNTTVFYIIDIYLKLDYPSSKVKSFITRRNKKKKARLKL